MSSKTATARESAVSRGSSAAASAGIGIFAAVIGYLVTYVLVSGEAGEHFEDVAEWKEVAWYFYNAHMVDIETSSSIGSWGGTDTINFIAESSSTSADALYFVPPLVLLGAGAFLAVYLGATDLGEGVLAGAPVAVGYAIVVTLGTLITEASSEGSFLGIEVSGSMAPEFAPAVVLGGLFYPLVFATAGAVITAAATAR